MTSSYTKKSPLFISEITLFSPGTREARRRPGPDSVQPAELEEHCGGGRLQDENLSGDQPQVGKK